MIRLGGVEVLGCRHELNIRYVTLIRQFRFRDGSSRETTLTSRRFVSMADVHHAGIEWTLVPEKVTLVPENWPARAAPGSFMAGAWRRVGHGGGWW